MPKRIDIEIQESIPTLQKKIRNSKSPKEKDRLKALLYIKEGKVSYQTELVKKLRYDRKTIYTWLQSYKTGGLSAYLSTHYSINTKQVIREETKIALSKKLSDPYHGITSYVSLLSWVKET